jgi:hypothetical protein
MPTLKQKAAIQKILVNPGLTVTEAMREVGYSENTVNTPSDVTRSKGWKELMDKYFPEEKVATVHARILDAKRVIYATDKGKISDMVEVEDNDAQAKGVDLAYKLRGSYAPDKVNITDETDKLTDEELEARITELKAKRNLLEKKQ